MAKIRVHELAKELDVQNKDILSFLQGKGVEAKASGILRCIFRYDHHHGGAFPDCLQGLKFAADEIMPPHGNP